MTRTSNARVAGVTFLVYIAAGLTAMAVGVRPHVTVPLTLVTSLCALVLGVTLYALTRDVDTDLAMLAFACRVIEAIPGDYAAIFFAVGSTLFAWLFLRGRVIPSALAWLGLFASILLVVVLLLQSAGFGGAGSWSSSLTWLVWLPALIYELWLAVWLIAKGATAPTGRAA